MYDASCMHCRGYTCCMQHPKALQEARSRTCCNGSRQEARPCNGWSVAAASAGHIPQKIASSKVFQMTALEQVARYWTLPTNELISLDPALISLGPALLDQLVSAPISWRPAPIAEDSY